MLRWYVMYWPFTTSPFDWPNAYGHVVGCDWHEAVENARVLWGIPLHYIVHATHEPIA